MKNLLQAMWRDDEGQDMVEYALIVGLISLITFVAVQTVGNNLNTLWQQLSTDIQSAT